MGTTIVSSPCYKHGEEVEKYAAAMVNELDNNAFKGDWREVGQKAREHMYQIAYHAAKLAAAMHRGDRRAILEFAADVGNQALIAADCYGALTPDELCVKLGEGNDGYVEGECDLDMDSAMRADLVTFSRKWADDVATRVLRGAADYDSPFDRSP